MIPRGTREAILAAMSRFDDARGLELAPRFRGRHKFALSHGGRLYPVKELICLATGVNPKAFSGGLQANRYLEKLGFTIIKLPETKAG